MNQVLLIKCVNGLVYGMVIGFIIAKYEKENKEKTW